MAGSGAYQHVDLGALVVGLSLATLIVISGLAWGFSKTQRLKRKLRAAQKWPIGELPENALGRVVGRAYPINAALTGPLTRRACVYYIATVEQRHSNGRSSYWKRIITEIQSVPFVLEDSTGRAIVDPTGAEVALDFDGQSDSGMLHGASEIQNAFLAKYGETSAGWIFNKSLRYREAVIEIGETIAVLGQGIREPDPDAPPEAAYRGAPRTRLRLTSSAAFPLMISDSATTTE